MDKKVTIVIPTKNRYDALAMTLWSLYNQTFKDWDLLILDNSDERIDVREHHLIGQILDMMLRAGNGWQLLFNDEPGPQTGHQLGLDTSETEFIWRIDDDEMAQPDTLERLYNAISKDKNIGAIAPLVLLPDSQKIDFVPWTAGKIGWADYCFQNQDCTFDKLVDVEHLHSSFIYRREVGLEIGGFFQGFSRVGHREETDFSYRIHKAGYKLLVDTGARITHLKMSTGGIRSNNPNHELWLADDRMFWERVRSMNPENIFVPMLCGIGDVISSTPMLQGLQEKNPDKQIVIGTEFPNIIPYTSWNHDIVKKLSNKSTTPYIKSGDHHVTDAWCKLYGVENKHKLQITTNSIANEKAQEICKEPTVLVFTESKYQYKHWANERWDEVVKHLSKKYNVITFPPFNHNLTTVIALLSHCKFFISIDSWAGHAGHAVGKKGIVLWGETDPKHFGYKTNINIEKAEHNQDVQWMINKELTNEKMLQIQVKDVILEIERLEKEL